MLYIKIGLSRSCKPTISESIVYRDATDASLPSRASQSTQIVFLCGNNMGVPITWKSRKLEKVTKSPMTSETMALAESAHADNLLF